MNPESSSFTRCGQHPSLFFTGFCSSCLVERLSSVESVERSPKPSVIHLEKQGECTLSSLEFENKSCQVRARKTLLSLFHLDDSLDDKNATKNQRHSENDRIGVNCNSEARVTVNGSVFQNNLDGQNFNSVSRVSSSLGAVNGVSVDRCARKKHGSVEDESLKEKGVSFWLGSVLSKKVMKWRIRSASRNNSMHEKSRMGKKQSEATVDFRRRSCDHRVSCDPNNALWEDPRHSWDGVMMDKVFTPSFTGINKTVVLNSEKTPEFDWRNSLMTHRRRMSLPEEAMFAAPRPSIDCKDTNRTSTAYLSEENLTSAESNLREPNGDVDYDEPQQDSAVLNSRRCHGWSKVWNRSITSPFRDFIQRRENVLERSLSESWRERHGEKNLETMETDGRLHGSSISTAKKQQILNRRNNVGNGELQRHRPNFQKKDHMLGRSRSVHYPSPGNPDSGLLRFYLTPLRSSRSATRKRRMKTSRSFARSILGL